MLREIQGPLALGTATLALVLAGLAPASAAPIDTHIQAGQNIWDDLSAERQELDDGNERNADGSLGGNGLLDVGDTLRGIFRIENINGDASPPDSPEIAGIFEIEVDTKTDVGGGFFDYTFTPHADFATEFSLPGGAMVAVWTDPNFETVREGCTAGPGGTCEGNITNGTLAQVYGFAGDVDEAWEANNTPEDTSVGEGQQTGDNLGTFDAALSLLFPDPQSQITSTSPVPFGMSTLGDGLGDDLVEIRLTGDIGGVSNLNTEYDISDDADIEFEAVPLPGTVALLGLGLVLLGFRVHPRA